MYNELGYIFCISELVYSAQVSYCPVFCTSVLYICTSVQLSFFSLPSQNDFVLGAKFFALQDTKRGPSVPLLTGTAPDPQTLTHFISMEREVSQLCSNLAYVIRKKYTTFQQYKYLDCIMQFNYFGLYFDDLNFLYFRLRCKY